MGPHPSSIARRACGLAALEMVLASGLWAQAAGHWTLIAGNVSADTADTLWGAKSTHTSAPPHTRIWMRHLLTISGSSSDVQLEYDLDCAEGTTSLLVRHGQVTGAPGSGIQSFTPDLPIPPEDRKPSDPAPGTLQAIAYRWGCARLKDELSKARGPEARRAPSGRTDNTWYAFPIPEDQNRDTMFVDWTRSHRVSDGSRLVVVWVKMTTHASDSALVDGTRAAYGLAEYHVQCGDGTFRVATVQVLLFDARGVFLGAADTPDAPLHTAPDKSREWGAAMLACSHVSNLESAR